MNIKEVVEFLLTFKDQEINFPAVLIAIAITFLSLFGFHLIRYYITKKEIYFNTVDILVKASIASFIELLIIWIFGHYVTLFAIIIGILLSLYIRNKYFGFLDQSVIANEDIKEKLELNELERKFKKTPNYSILEVLLYYGYISKLHKDFLESECIFESPDEMAVKLLERPILTETQLKEAKAIMNVIRREGKIMTREEALLLISKIEEERREKFDEEN